MDQLWKYADVISEVVMLAGTTVVVAGLVFGLTLVIRERMWGLDKFWKHADVISKIVLWGGTTVVVAGLLFALTLVIRGGWRAR